jgi:hypothetical protein
MEIVDINVSVAVVKLKIMSIIGIHYTDSEDVSENVI